MSLTRRGALGAVGAGLGLWLLRHRPARAEEGSGGRNPGRVREVVDGDTVILDDGRQVRLVGVMAPKLSLGRARVPTEPLAAEARDALAALVLDQRVSLWFGGVTQDRYGRHLAHLHLDSGRWIQGELLEQGWARVYTFADNRSRVGDMLARETAARQARRGIWRLNAYRVLSVDELAERIGSYQIVEGQVKAAEDVRGRAYLNFGDDWRKDFTVSIAAADRRRFAALDPLSLAGRLLRVRGWLGARNGPEIVATHPEQFELLET